MFTDIETYYNAIRKNLLYGNGYFYSTIFSKCFYPFTFLPLEIVKLIFGIFGFICAFIYFIQLNLHKEPIILICFILPSVITGNIDSFIMICLFELLHDKFNFKSGIFFGLLCFKPTLIYVIPFIFRKINKNWLIGFMITFTLNWLELGLYFLSDLSQIQIWVNAMINQANSTPFIAAFYFIGIQYSWLWYCLYSNIFKPKLRIFK